MSICQSTIICGKIWHVPLGALMCPTEVHQLFQRSSNQQLKAHQTAQQWYVQKSKKGETEYPRLHLWTDSWYNTSIISAV